MGDPLSIAASVIAVLQLTGTLISLGKNYIRGVKDAPKDAQQLVDELRSFEKVLSTLRDHVVNDKNLESTALQALNGQNGPLPACTLELQRLQLKLVPQKGLKGVIDRLRWPLEEKETSQYISQMERHKGLFTFAVTIDQLNLSKAIKAKTDDTNCVVHTLQTELSAQTSLEQAKKREVVLDWFYAGNFDVKHVEISSKRQSNTGEWLFQAPEFKDWVSQQAKLLWGYGIPGAGKTFLSSLVIDHFRSQPLTARYGVAYIYFDYMERDRQRALDVLSSLVKQLTSQIPHLPKEIEELYDRLREKHKRPTSEELYTSLITASKALDRVFIIFDALDECDPNDQRKDLLPFFHRLAKDGIRVFLTSRPHPEDIQVSLHDATKIELSAKETDIGIYIQRRIDENPRASRLVGQGNCKDMIVSTLVDCAKGMFLLVRFHIEHICQQTSVREILTELKKLKDSSAGERPLDPTYDRAVYTLRKQSYNSANLAFNVLSWLVKAKRILTIDELRHAVSVKPHQTELDSWDLSDKTTLLDVCASLVTIDENSNTIRLAHYTVQEYLLRKNVLPEDSDFRLAMACITYISFDIFAQGPCMSEDFLKDRFKSYPFLRYAARHLDVHLRACDETLTRDMFLRFLGSAEKIACYLQAHKHHRYFYWFIRDEENQPALLVSSSIGHYMAVEELLKAGTDVLVRGRGGLTALHEAVLSSSHDIIQLLLDSGVDPSVQSDFAGTALHLAVSEGHETIVQLLLEKGADLSAQDSDGWAPLHLAVSEGHETIVQLLLEKGADPSAQDNRGLTALHLAASGSHETIVQLLLEKGADLSAQDSDGWAPLHHAVSEGHETIVQLLLEKGADLSAQDNRGWTALHLAVSEGRETIVQLLLEKGADLSAQANDGQTALHLAVSEGHETIVRLLLEKGADLSAQENYGWAPLHLAACGGHETIVQLLLEKGADLSTQANDGWAPLHLAVSEGHETIVQLLLEKGADPSAQDNRGQAPLHHAAYQGRETIIQLLLEKGADPSVQDNDRRAPLHGAAYQGHETIVQLLLEKGADISTQDNDGWAPLHHAAYGGHETIVQLLLEKGADPSAQDNDGRAPLHDAAYGGHETIVQLLLEKGADISTQDNDGWAPLHHAAYGGHETIVQLLLEKGADPSAQDNRGQAPLHHAAYQGRETIIQLLLEKGADPSVQDNDRRAPLHGAAYQGHETIVQLLLEKGADISTQDNDGWAPLHHAAYGGHETIVQLLLEKGADPSAQDNDGRAPLHHAAYGGHETIVQLLLEKGADPSAQDNRGQAPLHHAAYQGRETIIQLLLEKGADLSAQDNRGQAPLHHAAYQDRETIIQLLLEKGADPSAQDNDGWTALHLAVYGGHKTIAQLLLLEGANTLTLNTKGKTAQQVALDRGHQEVAQLLGAPSLEIHMEDCEEALPITHPTIHPEGGTKRLRPNETPEQIVSAGSPSKKHRGD